MSESFALFKFNSTQQVHDQRVKKFIAIALSGFNTIDMTINDTIGAKLTHFLALDNENKVRKSK